MTDSTARMAHGMGREPVLADWPSLTLDDVRQLLQGYPVGAVSALLWHSPRPFSAAAVVSTERGQLFVKRHHQSVRRPAGLEEEHRFIAHLRDQGLPVADVLHDCQGHSAIAQGAWTYEVHAIAAGDDLYRDALSWTPFLNLKHAQAAGEALARLHQAAESFRAPPRQAQTLLSHFRLFAQPDPLRAIHAQLPNNPGLSAYLAQRDWQADIRRWLLPFHQPLLPHLSRQPPLWTHNDWHASNLLWDRDEVASVLDFGLADLSFALFDLATAIERNCVPWLELDQGGSAPADLPAVEALLRGYQRVRPLSAADLQALAALLPLVHADFALGEVAYFDAVVGSRASADLAYDGYLLGHARWFCGGEGQRLLAHIRQLAERD
jgi:Ser/Thr protein kinase RdoA (MazF antagonist)